MKEAYHIYCAPQPLVLAATETLVFSYMAHNLVRLRPAWGAAARRCFNLFSFCARTAWTRSTFVSNGAESHVVLLPLGHGPVL